MVQYQFEVDDEVWNTWKDTVPRSKKLDERLIELIQADTEGAVAEEGEVVVDEEELARLREEVEDGG